MASLASEGLLRLGRDWDGLAQALPEPERAAEREPRDHPYAGDLDVIGRASLYRLSGPLTSVRGRAKLLSWLLAPAEPETAMSRQGAIRELAPLAGFRAEFTVLGRLEGSPALRGLDSFLEWAEYDDAGTRSAAMGFAAWVLPPLLLIGLVGDLALGWASWWFLPALAQVAIVLRSRSTFARAFSDSATAGPSLRALVPQLALLVSRSWSDPTLVALVVRLGDAHGAAHHRLKALSRLCDLVESRRNMMYAIIAPILLLDVHLYHALDRWRRVDGASVRDWIEALGEWEALAALATLAHDHPDWSFPTFRLDGSSVLVAAELGHPLIPPARCVRNDVRVGPPGTFLLVTGSNMSGKSTLLRAIGTNVVLAAAGAPVCAADLTLPAVRLHTSMRVEDSLEEGVSLFMAELVRIKGIVDASDHASDAGERILFLLDEILHGTNTAERQIAARGVLRHLIGGSGIGAVSTHDLTLADAPDLLGAAQLVHFREEVIEGDDAQLPTRLTFDYKLREGMATTRNALKLLDAVGLGDLDLGIDA